MAQLRCAQTSELMLEGTPLEVATAAAKFAAGDVVFDDVGPKFDPSAVRQAHADAVAGFEATLAELPARAPSGEDADAFKRRRDALKATIAERKDRIAAGEAAVPRARDAMDAARRRVEERKAEDARRRR